MLDQNLYLEKKCLFLHDKNVVVPVEKSLSITFVHLNRTATSIL